MQGDDASRRRNRRLRRIFANENDVPLADAIDAPIELVLGSVAPADVHDLGATYERPLVDDRPLARRVHEHRACPVPLDDCYEFELVERVLRKLHLPLIQSLPVDRLALHRETAERITIVIALDEIVLGIFGSF